MKLNEKSVHVSPLQAGLAVVFSAVIGRYGPTAVKALFSKALGAKRVSAPQPTPLRTGTHD